MKSANPMPSALPSLTSVRSSSTIALTRGFCEVVEPVDPEAAGDVGVDRRAGDVLAAELDDQHVDLVERQRRHEAAGVLGELVLELAADVVGREPLDPDDVAGRSTRPSRSRPAGARST